jgi:hypothetical protein
MRFRTTRAEHQFSHARESTFRTSRSIFSVPRYLSVINAVDDSFLNGTSPTLNSRMANESPSRTTSSRRYQWFADSTVSWIRPSPLPLQGVTDQINSKLTSLKKRLFELHLRWGHPGLAARAMASSMQYSWTPRWGPQPCYLPNVLHSTRQTRMCSNRRVEDPQAPGGVLKMGKLEPGNLVFSDQYESPLLGRQYSARGNDVSTQQFRDGTTFCDAASSKLHVVHQVGLTGTETVQPKLHFERVAAAIGVTFRACCADSHVYTSQEFATGLASKGQGIRHSGVGGHHHNGVAKNAINHTVRTARTLIIYVGLR